MQMHILETLVKLRDDIKEWVTNNLVALDAKIESKTIPIDNELKIDSTNPVQNKIIKAKTDELANAISALDNAIETIQNNIDSITDDGSGEFNIADPSGNVIFKINTNGAHTTEINLSGTKVKETLEKLSNDIDDVTDGLATHKADTNNPHEVTFKQLKDNNIEDDESGEYIIADKAGNIIFKVDANGAHTTEISLSGTKVKETLETLSDDIDNINEVAIPEVADALATHKADTNNPHEVAFKQLKDSNIEDDESGEVIYADSNGNIIAKINANGLKTTKVDTNSIILNGKQINSIGSISDEDILSLFTEEGVI